MSAPTRLMTEPSTQRRRPCVALGAEHVIAFVEEQS